MQHCVQETSVLVSVYVEDHSVCSRCLNHGRSRGGELCVFVCVLRQLAEEAGHVGSHGTRRTVG